MCVHDSMENITSIFNIEKEKIIKETTTKKQKTTEILYIRV